VERKISALPFPASVPVPIPTAMTDREPHGTPRVGVLRVLLVDNDRRAATRSEAGLRTQLGERLVLSQVPSLALAIRSLMAESFDAVVLELDVADASGIATLAGIRGAAPLVPVVVYARALDDTLAFLALRAGAHAAVRHGTAASCVAPGSRTGGGVASCVA